MLNNRLFAILLSKILDNSKESSNLASEIGNNTIRAGLAVNSGEKTMMTTYNTIWVEFRAVKGIATKADQKEMVLISPYVGWKAAYRYYPSKEAAQKHIAEMASKGLGKNYICTIFTERQLADAKPMGNEFSINFTSKQISERITI